MAVLWAILIVLVALVVWTFLNVQAVNRRFPASGHMLEIGGRRVHVFTGGSDVVRDSGSPLLLIHGAASNGRELPAAFGHLLAGWRWAAPDRPGLGHSSRHAGDEGLGQQAVVMAGVVEQLFPGEAVIAVGHSWGSAVALRLALDRPDLIAGLLLLAPASHPTGTTTNLANQIAAIPVLGFVFSWLLPAALGPVLAPAGIARGFAPGPVKPVDYGDRIGTALFFRPATFRANAADMNAADQSLGAQAPLYARLSVPVTILSGQGDRIVSNRLHAKALTRDIPHARSFTVPAAGHMPHWVDPELVITAINQMLEIEQSTPQSPQ